MSQKSKVDVAQDDLRAEYDFTKGVRGKYREAYQKGTNLVLLDADVAAAFPDAASVNQALRLLAEVARREAVIALSGVKSTDAPVARRRISNRAGR